MSNTKQTIVCHQVLHGYKKGHSLLSSSIELTLDSKRTMLTMSDMSGQSMVNGYEEYLTGYQLKDQNMYVIAKTWYAPEMDRPGCVWTHSLLFNFQDLVNITSDVQILNTFRRPSVGEESNYNIPIDFINNNSNETNKEFNLEIDFIKNVYYNIYGLPSRPITIVEVNRTSLENLILNIWLQQWPRLKRNFSFCTGSINSRGIYGKPLDIQIIPKKELANIRLNEIYSYDLLKSSKDTILDDWISVAVEDLHKPSYFRKFLIYYGSDLKTDRGSFKQLTQIFLFFAKSVESKSIKSVIDNIGSIFPNPNEAVVLKNDIISGYVFANKLNFTYDDLFFALTTTNYYSAYQLYFDSLTKNISRRIKLFPNETFLILNNLLDYDINPLGEEVLHFVAGLLNEEDRVIYQNECRRLLFVLVRLNPSLAYQDEFWTITNLEKNEIFHSLLLSSNLVDWQKIIDLLIDKKVSFDFEVLHNKLENSNLMLLNALNRQFYIENSWCALIKDYTTDVLRWLKFNTRNIKQPLLKLIIYNLNPNLKETREYALVWIDILSNSKYLSISDSLRLKSFCVALAFNCNNQDSLELLKMSLESVYNGLKNGSISYESWSYIENYTVPLSFWNDWDKCKKLIRAVVDFLIRNDFTPNFFNRTFTDDTIFQKLKNAYNR